MTKKVKKHGVEYLKEVLKRKPDTTKEMRAQLENYMILWGQTIAGPVPGKKAWINEFNAEQVQAGFPDRGFEWLQARYQEISNCLVQLGFEYCPGLMPRKTKGIIRRFTPRGQLLAVVVDAALKPNDLIHITIEHALACKALEPEFKPKKVTK
tara:strand:+ start:789 stop:1247 length:459 start_codon:yes stop_codon:yes gene_type:complete